MLTWIRRTLGAVLFAVAMLALAGGLDANSEPQAPQVVAVVRSSSRTASVVELPQPAPPARALPITGRLPWGWLVFCEAVGVLALSNSGKRAGLSDNVARTK